MVTGVKQIAALLKSGLIAMTLLWSAACASTTAATAPVAGATAVVVSSTIAPVSAPNMPTPPPTTIPTATPIPQTTLLFTGVIVPARCVQSAIDERDDPDYLYAEVRELISQADIAVGVLNATISDFAPRTGCVQTYVLVGGDENADALQRAGFDVINVATNHIKNCGLTSCGDRAFFDTLDNLERVGIVSVGAGENLAAALQPVVVEINGVRFGFVAQGEIEQLAFASETTPGIAVLTEKNLQSAIAAARQVADVVIFMPHSGPEDSPMPSPLQQNWARLAVAAGADLVVGNHTHVPQGFQTIDGVPVFYGLGNFVFDQNWARDHQQSLLLQVVFAGDQVVKWQFIPTVVDGDGTVHIASPEEAADIMDRLIEVNESLPD